MERKKYRNKYQIVSNRSQYWDYSSPGSYFENVFLDEWVIMPDHVHFILLINQESTKSMEGKEKIHEFSQNLSIMRQSDYLERPTLDALIKYRRERRKMLIPKVVGRLKMLTSKQINILRKSAGKKVWQKDYIAHIIRDAYHYKNVKSYIINNPSKSEEHD